MTKQYQLLTVAQASALLQRHMPEKDALAWLEADRKNDPLIPFTEINGQIFYSEFSLLDFLPHIASGRHIRSNPDRRINGDKRACRTGNERRLSTDRRRTAAKDVVDSLDRRFMPGHDRRSDIDRRLLGGIDRRSINDRRGREPRAETR